MLGKGSNFGVDSLDSSAGNALKANLAGVALKSAEDEGRNLACNITSSLCVGESLVGSRLDQCISLYVPVRP